MPFFRVSMGAALGGLLLLACAGTSEDTPSSDGALAATAGGVRLRLAAANVTSGMKQSYDPGHGIRILKGIAPDVAMLQEFNFRGNSPADIRGFVDEAFGPTFSYFRESNAQIPNGIVSRYPIIESGEWDDSTESTRDFAWARIDVPGPADLWAVSVHLRSAGPAMRHVEAEELKVLIGRHVPPGDLLVVGGDLNTCSDREPAITTLATVVVTTEPAPVDTRGQSKTNNAPTSRCRYDWLLVDVDLAKFKIPTVVGERSFPDGLVVDTRTHDPISDLAPALASDSAAAGMQHMAVIRDFLVRQSVDAPGTDLPTSPPLPSDSSASRLFINEVLARETEPSGASEFIEIVNAGASGVDLADVTLSDAAAVRHTFAQGTVLPAGRAIVVFGGTSGIPAGTTNAIAASTGSLGISNGGDTITMRRPGGVALDSVKFTPALAKVSGVSMNRNPDGAAAGSWVRHLDVSAASSSPGTRANGASF